MQGRRLVWRFFLIELGALAAITLMLSAVITSRGQTLREAHAIAALEGQAMVIRSELERWMAAHPKSNSRNFFNDIGSHVPVAFTLYTRNGEVLAHSDGAVTPSDPPLTEIEGAVSRRRGAAIKPGPKGGESIVRVALPVADEGGHVEVIYATAPLSAFELPSMLGVGSGVALLAAAVLLAGLAAKVAANIVVPPVESVRAAAERMRDGGAIERLPLAPARELAQLSESLNEMTAAWDARLQTAVRQRNEQEAVLSSMVEGVLAVDSQQNIISINQAAAKIVGITPAHAQGQALDEIVRNSAMQEFVARALASAQPLKEEVVLHQRGRTQIIEAHGARLRGPDRAGIGAVVVLNDVTELRRLEQVRRDFVSNVSHELKTPVTSIKGFVETLLDGALADPEQAKRFLEIVQRQADRLNSIIEDLLTLSRLEQGDLAADEMLEMAPLIGPLSEAVELCSPGASGRGIEIELTCDPSIQARINTNLIQQGIVNLVDNAVKYSENNTSVSVEAIETAGEVLIFVRDQGCGIAADHLPRLFERFYRVDQARSRNMGGTGLGLSIVRHIVQSHHGRVTVESTPGIGSSFCIHLPKPAVPSGVGV